LTGTSENGVPVLFMNISLFYGEIEGNSRKIKKIY
jgi:hypothetical protein